MNETKPGLTDASTAIGDLIALAPMMVVATWALLLLLTLDQFRGNQGDQHKDELLILLGALLGQNASQGQNALYSCVFSVDAASSQTASVHPGLNSYANAATAILASGGAAGAGLNMMA